MELEGRLASVDSEVGRQGDRMEGLQGTVTVRRVNHTCPLKLKMLQQKLTILTSQKNHPAPH